MLKTLKTRRNSICVTMLAAVMLAASVNAAPAVKVDNAQGALFANSGTHYELSAEGDTETITFDVTVSDIPEGGELFFRTSTIKSDCIQSVFPTSSTLANGVPSTVSIRLRPNNSGVDAAGIVLLTYEYVEGDAPPPKATELRITQHSAEAAVVEQEASREDELTVIAMMESSQIMPNILFEGDGAELIYSEGQGVVSWSAQSLGAQLTVTDVSALMLDTPLVIEGFQPLINGSPSRNRYNVVIPPEQINYILSRKADEIVSGLSDKTSLIEDERRSNDTHTFLTPMGEPLLPQGAAVHLGEPYISIPDDGVMEFEAETRWLAAYADSDLDFRAAISYNGVPASEEAVFTIELSQPELYPSVMSALSEDPPELASDEPETSVSDTESASSSSSLSERGLKQQFDSVHKEFIYELYEGVSFSAGIPCGLITNGPVSMAFPSGVEYTVLRDDEPFAFVNGARIIQPGSYRILIKATEIIEDETALRASEITLEDLQNLQNIDLSQPISPENEIVHEGVFTFRIVSGMTNSLAFYNPPPGYKISGLKYGDVPVTNFSKDYVHLTTDGRYEFEVSGKLGEPEFVTAFERFTELPEITLAGVQNGMQTTKPVTFDAISANSDIETIDVRLNEGSVSAYNKTVSEPGLYRITATDAAGNSRSVTFRILYSVNISGWLLVGIIMAVFAGLFGYMYFIRTHMRVI